MRKMKLLSFTVLFLFVITPFASGVAPPISTDKAEYVSNEQLHLEITGGTPDGVVLIQFDHEGEIVWAIQDFYDGDGDYSETLSLPGMWPIGDYLVVVKDQTTGLVGVTDFILNVGTGPVDWMYELDHGWNLISCPITPDDNSVEYLLDDLGFYQIFTFDGFGYVEPESIEPGIGYWLLVENKQPLMITGVPIPSVTISLELGWDMIGGPYQKVEADTVFPSTHQIMSWEHGMYYVYRNFKPGVGYWALVLDDATIIIPPEV